MAIKIGDKVMYVPDYCFATTPDAEGNFPWVVGRKVPGRRGEDTTEELSDKELRHRLTKVRKDRTPFGRAGLELLRPKKLWEGVVTAVRDNGKFNVRIEGTRPGIVLEQCNVEVDPTGKKPHTIHEVPTTPALMSSAIEHLPPPAAISQEVVTVHE